MHPKNLSSDSKYWAVGVGLSREAISVLTPGLNSIGFQLALMADVQESISFLREHQDGLILLSGVAVREDTDLVQKLREGGTGSNFCFLIEEADPGITSEAECPNGVDDVLQLPIGSNDLLSRLKVARRVLTVETAEATQRLKWEETAQQSQMMNQALTVATQRFGELFNGLPVACFTFGPDGAIQDWNRAAEEQFGVQGYVAYQQPVFEILKATEGIWREAHIETIFSKQATKGFDWTLELPGGEIKHFACTLFLQQSPTGEAQGVISANLDITDRRLAAQKIEQMNNDLAEKQAELLVANRRLADMANTDTLTGLANRRAFENLLALMLAETSKHFSLLILDVDHFKSFNDTFGHQVGDDVLRMVAAAIRDECADAETACRYGGEEFVVLLPNRDQAYATFRAEAFRVAVEQTRWVVRDVTISLGVTTRSGEELDGSRSGEALEELMACLIHEADEALYASKESGRNRVTHWASLPEKVAA